MHFPFGTSRFVASQRAPRFAKFLKSAESVRIGQKQNGERLGGIDLDRFKRWILVGSYCFRF